MSKVSVWEGQSLPMERVAWLKVFGIPLHLLDPDVVKMIGGLFGKVLYTDASGVDDKVLTVNKVGVLVGEVQRINEEVKTMWNNRNYRVWVGEEQEEWVPDCVTVVQDNEDNRSSQMASSPVGWMPDSGNLANGQKDNEETCMGNEGSVEVEASVSVPKEGGGGLGNAFNYDAFLDLGDDVGVGGIKNKGVFVFKSRKKSKRLRKNSGVGLNMDIGGSPTLEGDSCERARPSKRNRAQFGEDSDPFSLDQLLGINKDKEKSCSNEAVLGRESVET
ncbi:hypothetical protein HanOQP8_Chr01g0020981 [Helianthus annuus]|nr:hypothetical protein HanOQP8_Chr01g0020981 [Helianthus annuus]